MAGLLQLRTFGGLSVSVDGAPGSGAAQQRKTLALLALLAAASRDGISRDKLLAYLWPDADAEHSRGLLKQACYALRRDLHQPDLFLGTTELRLNPAVIASDIQEFEAALERRDPAQAAKFYTGPFLDGFYLSDSPEFERWAQAERDRLRQRVGAALETLATAAGRGGDHSGAVDWWRRLAALDPLNSRVALGLMNALAAAGDRAGALQAARVHETLLREELGATPDAAVVELATRLREESATAAAPRSRAVAVTSPPKEAAAGGEVGAGASARRSPFARRAVTIGLALVAGGLLTGGWLLFGEALFGARNAETAPEPKRLVVLPFTNLGTADDEYFADGITEEIAARLAASGAFRVIASTSAQVYKGAKKGIPEIGRELGVDYVLEGSVRWQTTGDGPPRVRITPQLVRTSDDTHLWAEVYDQPLSEIFGVQSDIARKVVQALDITLLERQRREVEAAPTRNLQAYDYYLRGNDYSRRGMDARSAPQAAVRMYEKAVQLDSGFALAYALLSRVHSQMYWFHLDHSDDRLAMAKRAVDKALALEPGLPEAHQSLAAYYFLGHLDYDRALKEYAVAEARGLNIFGARGFLRMRQGNIREAIADLENARRFDPLAHGAYSSAAQAYNLIRDFPRAESLFSQAIALGPDRSSYYFMKAWLYLRWDRSTQRARAVLDDARIADVAQASLVQYAGVLAEMFDRRYEEATRRLGLQAPEVMQDQNRFIPRAQLYAQVCGLVQRRDLERAYYDSARVFVLKELQKQPDDSRLHSALGIALAGLGHNDQAIHAGQRAVAMLPITKEANRGYYRELDLAHIYVMVGRYDVAVERLEYLLSIPGHLTRAWLRIDPTWDPLRSHARFQKLVARGP
jgi:TolB-like protein/DNA-binding SARP family transcriptional activator